VWFLSASGFNSGTDSRAPVFGNLVCPSAQDQTLDHFHGAC
jgi:hypothetical protein